MRMIRFASAIIIIIVITASVSACSPNTTQSTTSAQSTLSSTSPQDTVLQLDPSQQARLNNIYDMLVQRDIPVKSINLLSSSEKGITVNVTIECDREDHFAMLNINRIVRVVNYSQTEDLNFDWIQIAYMDKNGQIILGNKQPLNENFIIQQYQLDDETVYNLITSNVYFYNFSINKLTVSLDLIREVSISLQVNDIDTARREAETFLRSFNATVYKLNDTQNAQIGACYIDLKMSSGQTLLVYSLDLSKGTRQKTLWQDDSMPDIEMMLL